MDFQKHLTRQISFSAQTFGPGERAAGIVERVGKELKEIAAEPSPERRAAEWVDVVILGMDGLWRALTAAHPELTVSEVAAKACAMIEAKQATNEARTWPDWRAFPQDRAIEHVRGEAA